MTYQKQTWENLPNQTTPITAERLNHMEDGIYEASVSLENLQDEMITIETCTDEELQEAINNSD